MMIQLIRTRYYQFIEKWEKVGLLLALKAALYRCEEAVPVEKDLSTLGTLIPPADSNDFRLVELSEENFESNHVEYLLKSRKEKVPMNLKKGYSTFVMIKNDMVVADMWCATISPTFSIKMHPDLKWFGIKLNQEECYLFDMYVYPDLRGKKIATFFMSNVMLILKEKGYKKVYAYFDAKNIPALWVHRLLGFKELPRFIIRKILLFGFAKIKS